MSRTVHLLWVFTNYINIVIKVGYFEIYYYTPSIDDDNKSNV